MANAQTKPLYNSKRWYQLRHRQLLEHPLCALCSRLARVTKATIVDHVRPHRGDPERFYDAGNLQSLCKRCHDGAKQQLEKSGTLRGCGLDGVPLDANHHWNRNGS